RCRIAVPKVRPQFAALSPDGATLAVMPTQWIHGTDLAVRLLSVPSGEEIKGLKGPSASAHWVGFSPDGKTILTGGGHGIRAWDPVAGKLVREIPGPAQAPVVYSADGKRLASHSDSAVLVWDMAKQAPVRPDLAGAGHTGEIRGITVSPDEKLVATHGMDGDVWVWAADTGRALSHARSAWGYGR